MLFAGRCVKLYVTNRSAERGQRGERMIRESMENYLETIYVLLQRKGQVRSIDVCNEMGYSKPTISVMMKQFRENGYVEMDSSGHITLTEAGLEIGRRTYERHLVLSEMLMMLGVRREVALEDACRIEHDISQETFECVRRHMEEHKKHTGDGSFV